MGGLAGSTLLLSWNSLQSISRIVIYDRINLDDGIKSGLLSFSDGSVIFFGAISNNGTPKVVTFRSRKVNWVKMVVTSVSSSTRNVGLAEFEVYSK